MIIGQVREDQIIYLRKETAVSGAGQTDLFLNGASKIKMTSVVDFIKAFYDVVSSEYKRDNSLRDTSIEGEEIKNNGRIFTNDWIQLFNKTLFKDKGCLALGLLNENNLVRKIAEKKMKEIS